MKKKPVGCDHQLGSYVQSDRCGVCGGKGDTCIQKKGIYTNDQLRTGYVPILEIPAGAKNIRITEQVATSNFLALSNRNGLYYLNGKWKIEFPRLFKFGGSVFRYVRSGNKEYIFSAGPINELLVVELLYQEKNRGIAWEYTIDKDENNMLNLDQDPLSGVVSSASYQVDPRLMTSLESMQTSNRYVWWIGGWTRCSRRCGGGQQQRRVLCVQRTSAAPTDRSDTHESTGPASEDALPSFLQPSKDENCDPRRRPVSIQSCHTHACPPSWLVGSWGECVCDLGIRVRSVQCRKGAVHPETGRPMAEQWLLADNQECEETRGKSRIPARFQKCVPDPSNCLASDVFLGENKSDSDETNQTDSKKKSDLDELIDELVARSPVQNCTVKQPYEWTTSEWTKVSQHNA